MKRWAKSGRNRTRIVMSQGLKGKRRPCCHKNFRHQYTPFGVQQSPRPPLVGSPQTKSRKNSESLRLKRLTVACWQRNAGSWVLDLVSAICDTLTKQSTSTNEIHVLRRPLVFAGWQETQSSRVESSRVEVCMPQKEVGRARRFGHRRQITQYKTRTKGSHI